LVEDFIQSGAVPAPIKKIGVFVNPTIDEVVEVSRRLDLDGIQLHGEESLSLCAQVRTLHPEGLLFKAFGIGSSGDLDNVESYSSLVDAFIFDTKSPQRGGTGQTFDWSILREYSGLKPFFLSGGIGPETISEARVVCQQLGAYGVDCSSLCEVSPGRKNLAKVRQVIDEVRRT
jgi:phosphoribosylanthranilate isomerase